jgi:hypothetical protein
MTKNKALNVDTLCKLRNIDPMSDEAQEFYTWSVLQLLNAIKEERDNKKQEQEQEPEPDTSLSRMVGCQHY